MYTTDAVLRRGDMKLSQVEERDIHQVAVPDYPPAAQQTWATLLARQQRVLPGRACQAFLDGLQLIAFPPESIPRLADISDRIEGVTGWRLVRVDGIVPDHEFFDLLAQRCFPSTDFIRQPEEIGYTPAPDMFHDLLGHAPLLTDARFCAFFERFGRAGVKAFELNHPARIWLPRIYWYTVEFGLIRESGEMRIYGSGILSSPDEVLYSLSDKPRKQPFDIAAICSQTYDIWHMQQQLFVIDSFSLLERQFAQWSAEQGLC
jgi:phenylalanine-4-hydroxylase